MYKFLHLSIIFICINAPVMATPEMKSCDVYQQGDLSTVDIAIFKDLEEKTSDWPPRFKSLKFREEYRQIPNLRHQNGYESIIRFELNVDTGQPVPQGQSDYRRNFRQNRDFRISIESTWGELKDHLPSNATLPASGNVSYKDFKIIGSTFGLDQISYEDALAKIGIDNYSREFIANNDFFISQVNNAIDGFMICDKENSTKVPYCEHFQIIAPFIVETRFKRKLLPSFNKIMQHSTNFTHCLMEE